MEQIKKQNEKKQKNMLLHVCCAPCSSHVLSVLHDEYNITAFFYNPNITSKQEHDKRIEELKRFAKQAEFAKGTQIVEAMFEPERFFEIAKGLEHEPERGERCYKCYELRLEETAKYAKSHAFDVFTTTLSISPHKNATWLNEIGMRLAEKYHIPYLYSDFKKKNGYAHSIELSKEYNLYRQDYCGCIYSKMEREAQKNMKKGLCIVEN